MSQAISPYSASDFYLVDELLSETHLHTRASVRAFVDKEILPYIEDWCEKQYFSRSLVRKMGHLGILGPTISSRYGGSGMDYMSYGVIMQEMERADSGMRSTVSVQGSLVMYPIAAYGSEAQRARYLPSLAKGSLLGCFGLTEPDYGSDPGGMRTRIVDKGDYYVLNGSKMWISNAPYADLAIVWAKDEQERVRGLIVERGMEGFSTPKTERKWSLRANATGELVMKDVRVPKANLLPKKSGLGAPLQCLDRARYGIAWGVIGAAMACYDSARRYALERKQFDKPIASFQLIQKKLAEMLTDITQAQLIAWRLGVLMDEKRATTAQISLAKRRNVEMAVQVAREARQIHGAMGISGDFPMMRHMMNLESVQTYEGTHEIHLLILGQEITGIPAFSS